MKFHCDNCRFDFSSDGSTPICPRCSSKSVHQIRLRHEEAHPSASTVGVESGAQPATQTSASQKAPVSGGPRVFGTGKQAWMASQSFEQKGCPDCGGVDFDLNWKRKEKTCKKCGHVLPLGRRLT